MHTLRRQVVLTIAYFSQFNYPVTTAEIWRRLEGSVRTGTEQSTSIFEVIAALRELCAAGVVERAGAFWVLRGASRQVQLRGERRKITEDKLRQMRPLVAACSALPCVQALVVTGSAAVSNASKEHDVDLLVITAPHTMWLVRPFLLLVALLFGKRRSWNHEEPNSWCFNLWLECSEQGLRGVPRTRYLAHEILQTHWLVERGSVRADFFATHAWVGRLYPRELRAVLVQRAERELADWAWVVLLLRPVTLPLNVLAYWAQRWYMKTHQTREKVSYSAAFFHPRDTMGMIYAGWRRQLVGVGLSDGGVI